MEKKVRMLLLGTENTSKEKLLLEHIRSILLALFSKGFVHTGIRKDSNEIYDLIIVYEEFANKDFVDGLKKHLSVGGKVIILSEKNPGKRHPDITNENLEISRYWISWGIWTYIGWISRYFDNISVPWCSVV